MKRVLTAAFVESVKLPEPGKRLDIWDSKLTGFALRVTETGAKSWCVLYRHQGRFRRLTIGSTAKFGLADARDVARRILKDIAAGSDPVAAKRIEDAESFGSVAALYIERHAKVKKRSWREDARILDHDILPAWKDRPARDISRKDVIALLDAIVARGATIQANRVRALVSKIFNFAIGRDIVETNPVYKTARPGQETARERELSEAELKAFWTALEPEPPTIVGLFKLALLTAARSSELKGARWTEFDEQGWWNLPSTRMKAKRPHRVFLGPTAQALLRELANDSLYAFPSPHRKPFVNLSKPWTRIIERADITNVTPHDLRRTAASYLARIGTDRETLSRILNHARSGVTGRHYDRYDRAREVQEALTRWDSRLRQIVEGHSQRSNVFVLPARTE
jgi:integrase